MSSLSEKEIELRTILGNLGHAVIAFSGGVDSSLLAYLCQQELGDSCVAVTARSYSFPQRELDASSLFCNRYSIRQLFVDNNEFDIDGFADNGPDRCYLCKSALFSKIRKCADELDIVWIIEGSNLDDEGDYRPGMQAIREHGVLSPLREAGFTKKDIRELSRGLGLLTADNPSFACLATRFAFGEKITPVKLTRVDKAEQFLLDEGLRLLRVRSHADLARIETDEEGMRALLSYDLRKRVHEALIGFGFTHVSVDLMGYRMGSMNIGVE